MPTTLLASPRLLPLKLQNVLDLAPANNTTTAYKSVPLKVSVSNYNELDTRVTLYHWLATDASTKETLRWDYISDGRTTTEQTVKFDPEKQEHHRWQAAIQFRQPSWSMWTNDFEVTPDDRHVGKSLEFSIKSDIFRAQLGDKTNDVRVLKPGGEFPKETRSTNINSFFFMTLKNSFRVGANVDVTLQTTSQKWLQTQEFSEQPGKESQQASPFFYERKDAKDYVEQFCLKVTRQGTGTPPLYGYTSNCVVSADDAGMVRQLEVRTDGFTLLGAKKPCTGKWETQRIGVC
ncbi:uncharacterized protein AB675_3759 [Cyphellophora attinorum]|uniref:Uncharacterized protein n=1 Tax=Cyphellophora attinorum TaxID=1664694 RepID=A0A0N1H280_9EURO|nr:uncharacterized protein AB675_3759 [Phialophora attinorum]KPI35237.1 hypothetical protein AB675_3759 [Phialophora attinorum]